MTTLDTAIQNALDSIGVSWCPSMLKMSARSQELYLPIDEIDQYPSCVQIIEDVQTLLPNGMIRRTIPFFMFDLVEAVDNDILEEINPKLENITAKIIAFKKAVESEFSCTLVGDLQKEIHTLVSSEVGINFKLQIEYYPCHL